MADGSRHPSVVQKLAGQSYLVSRLTSNVHSRNYCTTGLYSNGGAHTLHQPTCHVSGLAVVSPLSPITVPAPIERVKLLIQNQDEMLKSGRLSEPYKGTFVCSTDDDSSDGHNINGDRAVLFVSTQPWPASGRAICLDAEPSRLALSSKHTLPRLAELHNSIYIPFCRVATL